MYKSNNHFFIIFLHMEEKIYFIIIYNVIEIK